MKQSPWIDGAIFATTAIILVAIVIVPSLFLAPLAADLRLSERYTLIGQDAPGVKVADPVKSGFAGIDQVFRLSDHRVAVFGTVPLYGQTANFMALFSSGGNLVDCHILTNLPPPRSAIDEWLPAIFLNEKYSKALPKDVRGLDPRDFDAISGATRDFSSLAKALVQAQAAAQKEAGK